MAIKAIINNTEKEIEQIKNSDEQDIDYVYSRIGDTEVEGEPPISIKSIGGNLADYRIYGNTVDGESVGDLVTSGEHAGEYKVPVTVEGKNLLRNTTTSQTFGGVMVTVNSDGSMTCNGTAITHATLRINIGEIPSGIYKLSGCPKNGAYNTYRLDVRDSSDAVIVLDTGNGCLFDSTNAHHVELRIERGYTCDNLTFYPMIRNADITDDTYEPYHAPVTTPIYLPEPIKMVGSEAEYVDYAEQKQHRVRVNLFDEKYEGIDDEYDLSNSIIYKSINVGAGVFTLSTNTPKTSEGYCNIFLAPGIVDSGVTSSINGVYVSNPKTFTSIDGYITIGYRYYHGVNPKLYQTQLERGNTATDYEPYIENTDLNVTLPALPTIKGTNILSVNTSIQPSNIYIKDSFDYKKVFTATRAIEDELPLNYRNIEDSDSTLDNYRIYGNTVDGESVGDMTANLFDGEIIMGYHLAPDTGLPTTRSMRCAIMAPIQLTSQQVTITYEYDDDNEHCAFMYSLFNDDTLVRRVAVVNDGYLYSGTVIDVSDGNCIYLSFFLENQTSAIDIDLLHSIMLNSGSTALPYEPYGYKVPVTVSNGTDTLTTPIYLPEQIRKVGDEAEYIDYGEQKMHRVRKNLFDEVYPGIYESSQPTYRPLYVGDGSFTMSSNIPPFIGTMPNTANIFLLSGNVSKGGSSIDDGVYNGKTITKQSKDGYITIAYRIYFDYDPRNYKTMINSGSTPLPYEPYIENTDLDVTLPALPTIMGTNVLSVGTAVQPSEVYVKGKIKEIN